MKQLRFWEKEKKKNLDRYSFWKDTAAFSDIYVIRQAAIGL